MSSISARHLGKSYGRGSGTVHALSDVSFTIDSGEFIGIMGESGAGKSTLLSILGAMNTPSTGTLSHCPGHRQRPAGTAGRRPAGRQAMNLQHRIVNNAINFLRSLHGRPLIAARQPLPEQGRPIRHRARQRLCTQNRKEQNASTKSQLNSKNQFSNFRVGILKLNLKCPISFRSSASISFRFQQTGPVFSDPAEP